MLDMTIFSIKILFVSSNLYVFIKFDIWLIWLNNISILILQILINITKCKLINKIQ